MELCKGMTRYELNASRGKKGEVVENIGTY